MTEFEDNRVKCSDCGDFLKDDEHIHTIQHGMWNAAEGDFNNSPVEEPYCRDCWSDIRPSKQGVDLELTSSHGFNRGIPLWAIPIRHTATL